MAENMTMPTKQQRLLQLIECPVCLNEQHDPRMLSCRHALCYTCLKNYTDKNKYDKELPCPVCRVVTTLYEGGVDNLPKFFFMNELKEVIIEEEGVKEEKTQKPTGVACSTEDCEEVSVSFCTKGCEFLCQLCDDEHRTSRRTKSHKVVTVSEGEEFTRSSVPPYHAYPPCHRHTHQVVDLYCRTCDIPICTTCCQVNHQGHDCIEIDKQGKMWKAKLEQISENIDGLIYQVKHAMDTTKCQAQQAETDIDDVSDYVKCTFKEMHDKLDEEEKNILSDLQKARMRVLKTAAAIADSQMITLASMESLESCKIKLVGKDNMYDYVTVTESMEKDLDTECHKELAVLSWSSQFVKESDGSGDSCYQRSLEFSERQVMGNKHDEIEVEVVSRIRLHDQNLGVRGLVVHKTRVYVVHKKGLVIYCYEPHGSLSEMYNHEGGAKTLVQGMCLVMNKDGAMLVVSDCTTKSLVWIQITDDGIMQHHHKQPLGYAPRGSCSNTGNLIVCDADHHTINSYTCDGQPLSVITLSNAVNPWGVTGLVDGDQYAVRDWENHQVVVVDKEGTIKAQYNDVIHGIELDALFDIITDKQGRLLIVDHSMHHVLLMSRKRDDATQLLHGQMWAPSCAYLDEKNHKMYVAAKDKDNDNCVFVYDYNDFTGRRTLTENITALNMVFVL